MRVDRHSVPADTLTSALSAVPKELDRETELAQYGGVYGIEKLADMLVDYTAARTVEIDPHLRTRETWLALTSAARLLRDHARASTVPAGGRVSAFVDYLGVGFSFNQEEDERLTVYDWCRAYEFATILGDGKLLDDLYELEPHLPEDSELRGFRAYWRREPGGTPPGADPLPYPDTPEGRALRAIADGDADAFNTALAAAVERHRELTGRDPRNPRDLIAWGAAAIAAIAHEHGLPVEVDSDYLPERLYTRAGPEKPTADGPLTRPDFDADRAAEWLNWHDGQDRDQHYVERAFSPKVKARFSALASPARELALATSFRSVLDPRAETAAYTDALAKASESLAAAFRLASAPRGTPVTVTLHGRTGELTASGPNTNCTAWLYAQAAALAWITRRQADREILAAFDPRHLHTTQPDASAYAHACHAVLNGTDPRPHLRRALAKTSGDGHWECLRNPRARLLDRIAEDDPDGFNAALADALGLYRDYYSAGDNIGDPDGQLSYDALAMACLAHDRGIPVRVESDYLPRAVIEGLSPH